MPLADTQVILPTSAVSVRPNSTPADSTPALVATAGARASYRFLEFFTAQIRNPRLCPQWTAGS